jgi:hypothetical protein
MILNDTKLYQEARKEPRLEPSTHSSTNSHVYQEARMKFCLAFKLLTLLRILAWQRPHSSRQRNQADP